MSFSLDICLVFWSRFCNCAHDETKATVVHEEEEEGDHEEDKAVHPLIDDALYSLDCVIIPDCAPVEGSMYNVAEAGVHLVTYGFRSVVSS